MRFQILSHAGLMVESGGTTLVIDPWMIGSCYWRSWWNYPPVDRALAEGLTPDIVFITHSHWDHFHGPTLKRFARNTPIVIAYERSTRMRRDLRAMGFTDVTELRHGSGLDLASDFRITCYQFASPWGDSAPVVEAEGISLFNANDAKFMGGPLSQILRRHGRFDFAFRSHSSANDRLCYQFTDHPTGHEREDRTIYARSWFNFMRKVRPRYAVPFASNHCYLHREVVRFNEDVETPLEVKRYVDERGGLGDTEVKIMVSGDSWDSATGFRIAEKDYFSSRQEQLARYAKEKETTLARTYAMEEKVRLTLAEVERFFGKFFASIPRYARKKFRDKPIVLCAKHGEGQDYFVLDLFRRTVEQSWGAELPPSPIIYEAAARVLKHAMAKNMFAHVEISKRVVYRLRFEDAKYLNLFKRLLAAYEYEALPLFELDLDADHPHLFPPLARTPALCPPDRVPARGMGLSRD